jgi:hypothetical protein
LTQRKVFAAGIHQAGTQNSIPLPTDSGRGNWWDDRPPPPPPTYSCYRGWDSSHYDQVMGTLMQKPLHADLHPTVSCMPSPTPLPPPARRSAAPDKFPACCCKRPCARLRVTCLEGLKVIFCRTHVPLRARNASCARAIAPAYRRPTTKRSGVSRCSSPKSGLCHSPPSPSHARMSVGYPSTLTARRFSKTFKPASVFFPRALLSGHTSTTACQTCLPRSTALMIIARARCTCTDASGPIIVAGVPQRIPLSPASPASA